MPPVKGGNGLEGEGGIHERVSSPTVTSQSTTLRSQTNPTVSRCRIITMYTHMLSQIIVSAELLAAAGLRALVRCIQRKRRGDQIKNGSVSASASAQSQSP